MPPSPVALAGVDRARRAWIVGPLYDLPWIVLCPLIALVVMEAPWGLSDDAISTTLFAFVVTGHHMPGWLRAFLEPAVYERHKAKLWASAVFIPAMVLVPAAYGLGMLVAAVGAIFDLWHTSLRHHGFARIYSGEADAELARAAELGTRRAERREEARRLRHPSAPREGRASSRARPRSREDRGLPSASAPAGPTPPTRRAPRARGQSRRPGESRGRPRGGARRRRRAPP